MIDRDVLKSSYNYHHGRGSSLEKALIFTASEQTIKDKIKKLVKQGYLDYKLNLFTPWLTEKGKEYLKELLENK